MSSGVATLPARGRGAGLRPRVARERERERERPLIRLAAFAALAGYGVLRWATLLSPAAAGRLFGLLVLAVAIAGAGPMLIARRARPLAILAAVFAVLAMFALAGIPVRWVTHLRIAVTARAIGNGLQALPSASVPYVGINQWVRIVNVLGAGVLLLDAGLLMAFAPRSLGDVRRAAAALPLLALAIVPTTLLRPQLPYVQGLLLFALLAAFMWGDRVRIGNAAAAGSLAALAGIVAIVAAPALDTHSPWVNYEAIAANLSPAHVESFNWAQTYGPLVWPRDGTPVLEIKAARPDYWKAENLDIFNGTAWMQGLLPGGAPQPAIPDTSIGRWTQELQVTIRAMRTTDVIAAGTAQPPSDISQSVVAGPSPGTWTTGGSLIPGDSYLVTTYSPQPTAAELAAAPNDTADPGLQSYLTMTLPPIKRIGVQPDVIFAPFHSTRPVGSTVALFGTDAAQLVRGSPYAPMYALAQRLARTASTPYAFARSIERYLSRGFVYVLNPTSSAYPLENFLFQSKVGYCQQFAGAMALLLRMGGVPARVAVGFTTGSYSAATHNYVVTDQDAHAWVEAWFAGYGWVRFDPTPAGTPASKAPATSGHARGRGQGSVTSPTPAGHAAQSPDAATSGRVAVKGSSTLAILAGIAVILLLAAGAAFVLASRRERERPAEELLAELERALRRTGRPVGDGVTLVALEHRFRTAPDAAAYVRAIRLARFAGSSVRPTAEQRRALRGQLRAGLGMGGALRAMWALPPLLRLPPIVPLGRTRVLN